MISVIVSVLLSAAIFVALLLLTRQRLARQFEDIERRLLETERTVLELRLKALNDTSAAQLKRLHAGVLRLQENAADRHAALLARDGRSLSEVEIAVLEGWASAAGLPPSRPRVEKLARAATQAEVSLPEDVSLATRDLVAVLISLIARSKPGGSLALAGDAAETLAPLLRGLAPAFFEGARIFSFAEGNPAEPVDAAVADAAFPGIGKAGARIKPGGLLVLIGAESGATEDVAGFEPVAGEWNTRVYRKAAD